LAPKRIYLQAPVIDRRDLPEDIPKQAPSLPVLIRVSLGTAITIGLDTGRMDTAPTTAYLMTYHEGKCIGNCGFCPQAREAKSSTQLLSRITWPTYPTSNVISDLSSAVAQKKIKRVCIQALNYHEVFEDIEAVVLEIKSHAAVAVSVSCQPKNREDIERLKSARVNRLGIALDAATQAVFDKVKGKAAGGCYNWEKQFELFNLAQSVFGKGNVSTHVIVGLGETEKEALETIQRCVDLGVLPALFAFTPVRGTALEGKAPPKLESYRRIQLARHLIVAGKAKFKGMSFSEGGEITGYGVSDDILEQAIKDGAAFRTSGCPDCNRPYYNEKPSGPIYNYPKTLTAEEINKIKSELS
jgi:lipoyl synthase